MFSTRKALKYLLPGLCLTGSAVGLAGLTGCEVEESRPAYHLEGDGYRDGGYRDRGYEHGDYDRGYHHYGDRDDDRIERERQQENWNRSHY